MMLIQSQQLSCQLSLYNSSLRCYLSIASLASYSLLEAIFKINISLIDLFSSAVIFFLFYLNLGNLVRLLETPL